MCGYVSQVEELAALKGIALRTGAFCNPGATRHFLGLSKEDVARFVAQGKVCGDARCVLDGKPTGAVRVSFGYMSTRRDADALVAFLAEYFLDATPAPAGAAGDACARAAPPAASAAPAAALSPDCGEAQGAEELAGEVVEVYVYPIKSCGAHACPSGWPLTSRGLLYDRVWAVVDMEGRALTQKSEPALARIMPAVHRGAGGDVLRVACVGREDLGALSIPADALPVPEEEEEEEGGGAGELTEFLAACGLERRARERDVVVCGRQGTGVSYGCHVNAWFSAALGRECMLVRQGSPPAARGSEPPSGPLSSSASSSSTATDSKSGAATPPEGAGPARPRSYHANGGQLLMVTEESIHALWRRLRASPHCGRELQADSSVPSCGGAGRPQSRRSIAGGWQEARRELILRLRPNLVVRGSGGSGCGEGWEDGVVSLMLRALGHEGGVKGATAGPEGAGVAGRRGRVGQTGAGTAVQTSVVGPCFRCGMVNVDQVTACPCVCV